MSSGSRPAALSRLASAVLSIPLRFKITVPYLVVALLLAGLATWLVSQSLARSLEDRFRAWLADEFVAASEAVFQDEVAQLTAVRALAYTVGLPEAVAAADVAALEALIRPAAVNGRLAVVQVLDAGGQTLYSLQAVGDDYQSGGWPGLEAAAPVRQVLEGQADALGDKFAGIADLADGALLYAVGPVKTADRVVGAVIVGAPLADRLARWSISPLARVSAFRPDGALAATTFGMEAGLPALAPDLISAVGAAGHRRLPSRLVRVGNAEFQEAVGALTLRGQPSGWLLSVALPRALAAEGADFGLAPLMALFAVGVLAIIGLGVVVAQVIAVPVFELVRASSQVAAGRLDVSVPSYAQDELGLLARHFNQMVGGLRQREFMRDLFGRVVSEEVREALLKGDVPLGGELKVVTVLFTDIRQFTALSEKHRPQDVVQVLNGYFAVVNGVIREVGGFVNKFGGDSTMAVFGAPVSLPAAESARRALRAALLIRARLAEFNARRAAAGQQPIAIGVGINTGEVITGNVGSAERFEYTVIGDTVNVAARVQALTAQLPGSSVLITEPTLKCLGPQHGLRLVDHGAMALKGKAKPVRVYGVVGLQPLQRQLPYETLEAAYLFCRGFSPEQIALTQRVAAGVAADRLASAQADLAEVGHELVTAFGLEPAALEALRDRTPKASPELEAA